MSIKNLKTIFILFLTLSASIQSSNSKIYNPQPNSLQSQTDTLTAVELTLIINAIKEINDGTFNQDTMLPSPTPSEEPNLKQVLRPKSSYEPNLNKIPQSMINKKQNAQKKPTKINHNFSPKKGWRI